MFAEREKGEVPALLSCKCIQSLGNIQWSSKAAWNISTSVEMC